MSRMIDKIQMAKQIAEVKSNSEDENIFIDFEPIHSGGALQVKMSKNKAVMLAYCLLEHAKNALNEDS